MRDERVEAFDRGLNVCTGELTFAASDHRGFVTGAVQRGRPLRGGLCDSSASQPIDDDGAHVVSS